MNDGACALGGLVMPRNFIVGFDLDGVAYDLVSDCRRVVSERTGTPEIELPSVVSYSLWEDFDIPAETFWEWMDADFHAGGLWHPHQPISPAFIGAVNRVEQAGAKAVVVTARPEWARTVTRRWLDGHGINIDLVHTHNKHLAGTDIHVDDSPDVWHQLHNANKACVLLDRIWNRECVFAHRVWGLHDFANLAISQLQGTAAA